MLLSKIYTTLFLIIFSALIWNCKKIYFRPQGSNPPTDSAQSQLAPAKADTGVCIGNSIIAGHPWRRSGLELGNLNYPDSFGQISYHLAQLANFPWYDRGIGKQTTGDIRKRFLRDAIGLTSDPGDGRGARTLSGTPSYVVVEGGVNDIDGHIALSTIEDNLTWMASTCKQYNVHCIVLNCVGQGNSLFNDDQIKMISDLNKWLAAGALDSTNATVVDINSLWNSGSYQGVSPYGNDNVHYSSLVNEKDGIHFTQAGYDSVANVIYRVAKLP